MVTQSETDKIFETQGLKGLYMPCTWFSAELLEKIFLPWLPWGNRGCYIFLAISQF